MKRFLHMRTEQLHLHSTAKIHVRVSKTMADGSVKTGTIESTLGRFIFNEIIPQDLGFVDREVEGHELLTGS